jgi:heme exporter protein CcmD
MQSFFAMGGYAGYVWSSYVLAAVIIAWNVASAVRSHTHARARALRQLAMASPDAVRRAN